MRLSVAIAKAGIASRREAEKLIFASQVKVNNAITITPQTQVTVGKDVIEVNGIKIIALEKKVYYILNKPKGYLCTNDPRVKKTVTSLFPHEEKRLFTVGRLDKETTGLLIVTNDGEFANEIIHPSNNVSKEYVLKTNCEILPQHINTLMRGGWVEGTYVRPEKVQKVRRGTVKIIVGEGKKREIRQLAEKAELKVLELKRTRIGPLHLGNIPEGGYRKVSEKEMRAIFQ